MTPDTESRVSASCSAPRSISACGNTAPPTIPTLAIGRSSVSDVLPLRRSSSRWAPKPGEYRFPPATDPPPACGGDETGNAEQRAQPNVARSIAEFDACAGARRPNYLIKSS